MSSSSAAQRIDETPAIDVARLRAAARAHWPDVADYARRTAKPGDIYDEFAAAHAAEFFPRYLKHTKGEWAGQPFELIDWQDALIRTAFGWKRADGKRRFRIVYARISKKNGKTGIAAGTGLYLAFSSGEMGAEVYCAANDTKQANICFAEAKRMRGTSAFMRARTNAFKHNISDPETFSKFELISAEVGTKEGLNVSGLVLDEVHVSKSRDLYDTLHTATAARAQPMEWLITTAGDDVLSWCHELDEHAQRLLAGEIEDHEFLPVIYGADPQDDPHDPLTWFKANPSLGITIGVDYFQKESDRAKVMPRTLNRFKRYHLGIWVESETAWLPKDHWKACAQAPLTLDMLAGRACWAGLDLSSTTDLTALALLFPRDEFVDVAKRDYDLIVKFWMPKGPPGWLEDRAKREGVPYDHWVRDGWITATEGDVVDYDAMRAEITGEAPGADEATAARLAQNAIVARVNLRELARDRWNASQISTQLMADGVAVVDFGQGYRSMSAPAKEFEQLVQQRRLNIGHNPVLAWMGRVVTIKTDPAENIKPVKPDRRKSAKRIDGIVAAIMALGRAIAAEPPKRALSDVINARGGLL